MSRPYSKLVDVQPFWHAYWLRWEELHNSGRYPYDADFRGRVGAPAEYEDTVIYTLQSRRRLQDDMHLVALAIEEGFTDMTPDMLSVTPRKFARVIRYGWFMGGTGYQEWTDVRLSNQRNTVFLMEKGARTSGKLLMGGKVMVKS